ncbi:DUF3299 domain-containing protein [Aliiglaciecola sp. M165]|uniref:DUF3299 domain-containing protein n=1 Tax=Aliiglaciecola sp. M165 TaxID=2593649 RepID=UPI00117E7890|nr:DUF3299 domain-containing protein [Aliiglaciecola sp. M165]TRY33743.1 DUF3299 domain-containing protein [Aliiglaciecola sp. M165]
MKKSLSKYRFVIGFILPVALLLSSAFARASNVEFKEIEWIELMPEEDLAVLLDPPDFLLNIEDGSEDDNLDTLAQKSEMDAKAKRFNEVLKSERVIAEFDGRKVRIPGFIVPLSTNEKREVVEFFIVPYFGACLHLPPPPPNQIIFGKWSKGIEVRDLSNPMWFEGEIYIETVSTDLGTSAYGLRLANVEPY